VKSITGRPVEESDVGDARVWGNRLGVEELMEILRKGTGFLDSEKAKIQDFAALYSIRLLENVGLDVVYDGEQRCSEMYDHAVRHAKGFETRGTVRSWDNKYYTKAAVTEKPLVDTAYDREEYEFVRSHTERVVKVPFTGAYTIVDWSTSTTPKTACPWAPPLRVGPRLGRGSAWTRHGTWCALTYRVSSRPVLNGSRSMNPLPPPAPRRCRSSSRPSTPRERT
jgi:hypothetical protein